MKKYLFIISFLLLILPIKAQLPLSEESRISILTSYPSDEEVFTLYGHTAIRILDPAQNIDLVFNYGIFDFHTPNFIYRFAKGETDYMLGVADFQNYFIEYQMRGSKVVEQALNLNQVEKEKLWQALIVNYEPQNRTYRYNFFFDNCSTKPRDLVEKAVEGKINYKENKNKLTFRDLINDCTRNHYWYTFGCDLALGSPTDRITTIREQMFLPLYLVSAFDEATISTPSGESRKLVQSSSVLIEENKDIDKSSPSLFSPLFVSISLLLAVTTLTIIAFKRKKIFRGIDIVLFSIAGRAGLSLFFLSFISTHPATNPNWSLIWLHPFHLIGVILFSVKKLNKAAYYYHFINFAALTLLLIGWYIIPQQFNTAFIPLVLTLWMRSGYSVYIIKKIY